MTPRRLLVVTAAAGLLTLGAAVPAAAEPTADSTATITITGGALEISVNTTPRSLGRRATTAKAATISGTLGQVVVRDRRGAPEGSGWVASVVSSAFRSRTGPAIPASNIRYTAGPINRVGPATYTANNPTNLKHAKAAVTASNITGYNTATWNPTLHVNITSGLTAGVYTATITHSVV